MPTAKELYDIDPKNFLEAVTGIVFTHTHPSRKGNQYRIDGVTTSGNKRQGEICVKAYNLTAGKTEKLHYSHFSYLIYTLEQQPETPKEKSVPEKLEVRVQKQTETGKSGLEADLTKSESKRAKTPEELAYEESARKILMEYGIPEEAQLSEQPREPAKPNIAEDNKIEKPQPLIRRVGK